MLKLFLMTRNEIGLLEDWLKYHGQILGFQNIIVLDGSSEQPIFDIYNRYKPFGLSVHHTSTGLNGLSAELTELMHAHRGRGDYLIKLDTDEFLAYAPSFKTRPASFLERHGRRGRPAGGVARWLQRTILDRRHRDDTLEIDDFPKFLESLPITGQRYKASLTTWSVPQPKFVCRPCRELTEFTPIQHTHFKTFFHSDSFISVDLGGHHGISTNNEGVIDTGLTVIHYHSTSVDDSARRAKQVLNSHKYIDLSDTVSQQLEKLLIIRAKGHVASFHKIDFYIQYLRSLQGGPRVDPQTLNRQHPYFRAAGASRELLLVKDTLANIDRIKEENQ